MREPAIGPDCDGSATESIWRRMWATDVPAASHSRSHSPLGHGVARAGEANGEELLALDADAARVAAAGVS
jgi:hypothetical protein